MKKIVEMGKLRQTEVTYFSMSVSVRVGIPDLIPEPLCRTSVDTVSQERQVIILNISLKDQNNYFK